MGLGRPSSLGTLTFPWSHRLSLIVFVTCDLPCCASFRCTAMWLSYTSMSILFQILSPFRLLQNIEQSSLCCIIGRPLLVICWYFKYSNVYTLILKLFIEIIGSWHFEPDNPLLTGRGCHVLCRIFNHITGLSPLDASGSCPSVVTTRNVSRHCQISLGWGKKIHPLSWESLL